MLIYSSGFQFGKAGALGDDLQDAALIGKAVAQSAVDDGFVPDAGLDGVTGIGNVPKGEKIVFAEGQKRGRHICVA